MGKEDAGRPWWSGGGSAPARQGLAAAAGREEVEPSLVPC